MSEKKKWFEKLANWLESKDRMRVIYDRESNEPYLIRHYILFKHRPKWFPFNIFLHRFLRSDIDGLHDHPWKFWGSFILSGGYWEDTEKGRFWRKPGWHGFKGANFFHRVVLDEKKAKGPTWTLFFVGYHVKDWGFLNHDGKWVQWEEYLSSKSKDPKLN